MTDRAGEWHAAPAGSVGSRLDVPHAYAAAIHAVGAGYLATWTAGLDTPRVSRWPMMMLISPAGALARPPEMIEPPRDDLPFQYAPVAVGSAGPGVALVWEAVANGSPIPSALLFRSLGCLR